MNSTSHDAQGGHTDEPLRLGQAIPVDGRLELDEVADPTEDLSNDVTSELPGPGMRLRVVPQNVISSDSVVADDESAGSATVATSGAVLRERYILELPLGYGGTSVVMRARDLRRADGAGQGPEVAIKLLRPEFRDKPQCIARLRREFHQTQSVAHPNVVRFYDLDCDHGAWFIAMELLTGESLGRCLRRACPVGLTAAEALRISAACGDALAYAHDRGVTHGDVKPDNVFLTATGEVRVLDFGVVPDDVSQTASADTACAVPVMAAATRAYASPEVLSGQAPESRDDVFSLACVTYEMLAGRHPYGRSGANEARDAGLEIERPPGLSTRQWQALAAGLAWSRERRPGVRELMQALSNDAPDPVLVPEVRALPVSIVSGQLLKRSRGTWRGPLVIAAAIVLGVLIGRFAFDSAIEPQSERRSTPVAIAPADMVPPKGVGADAVPPVTRLRSPAPPPVPVESREARPTGLVAFDLASMIVSGRAVVAAIPVRHFSLVRRGVTVGWRVIDGSAVAGRDYGGPLSGVAKFAEGHTFRIIYVPIIAGDRVTHDRTFTVELTGASIGADLGTMHRVLVTIQGDA